MKDFKQTIRQAPLLTISFASSLFVSCEKKGSDEEAGEAVDQKVEQMKDAAE